MFCISAGWQTLKLIKLLSACLDVFLPPCGQKRFIAALSVHASRAIKSRSPQRITIIGILCGCFLFPFIYSESHYALSSWSSQAVIPVTTGRKEKLSETWFHWALKQASLKFKLTKWWWPENVPARLLQKVFHCMCSYYVMMFFWWWWEIKVKKQTESIIKSQRSTSAASPSSLSTWPNDLS